MVTQEKIDAIYDMVKNIEGDLKAYNVRIDTLHCHIMQNSERINELKSNGTPIRARDWGTIIIIILTISTMIFGAIQATRV